MIHRIIQERFSLLRISLILIVISAVFQASLIGYNHLTGFYEISGFVEFLNRFLFSTVLTFLGAWMLTYPDLWIIHLLDKFFPWDGKRKILRGSLQLIISISFALTIGVVLTLVSHSFSAYERPLGEILIINMRSFVIANIVLISLLEAWIFFTEGREAMKRQRELEHKLTTIRFEVLKKQMNPHFLFNSLNVLSGLIEEDTDKAQQFINRFSNIYQYVLKTIEQPLVSVKEEVDFLQSYTELQQMRFGNHLIVDVDLSRDISDCALPPLSLQVLVENAIKHNIISDEHPLHITVKNRENRIITTNSYQPKQQLQPSSKLGQKQLIQRYELIRADELPQFSINEDSNTYVASLPFFKSKSLPLSYEDRNH